jgi:alkylhydroperoxidase/carboxymuconolactone decarboxylase family protein YurZ
MRKDHDSERYTTGQEMLQRVDGKGGEAVVNSLQDIAPDFARYLIEFPFGDIYARRGSIYAAVKSPPLPRSPRWAMPRRS